MAKTVWLIAGHAAYRVVCSDEYDVLCKIEAGSDRVRGREVTFPRVQVQAAIALGEMRAVNRKPKSIDAQLAAGMVSKLDQEAALTTAKAAHWKGTKPDEPTKRDDASPDTVAGAAPGQRVAWETDED